LKILGDSYQHELLERLRQGDEPAFNLLYKAYSKPLYLRIMRMVKNKDTADELLQELFIKLWNSREKIDSQKSFQSYMYTIAQHMVYNYFRKVVRNEALINSLLQDAADHYLSSDTLLEDKQTAQLLQDAIDQLSPQRKQVFNLCKVEGKSYEEAARIMGISTATVNSHMTRAIQSIKEYVLKHQDLAVLLMTAYALSEIAPK